MVVPTATGRRATTNGGMNAKRFQRNQEDSIAVLFSSGDRALTFVRALLSCEHTAFPNCKNAAESDLLD